MKRIITIILTVALIIPSVSIASDIVFTEMTIEELIALRDKINAEITTNIVADFTLPDVQGQTLREIFPCIALAKLVRDQAGMVSIDQAPTAEQLEKITSISSYNIASGDIIDDLTGISYLVNLNQLQLYEDKKCSLIKSLPDEFFTLKNVRSLDVSGTGIDDLTEAFCNMVSIKSLTLWNSHLTSLPKNIGNLINLNYLNIMYTKIAELPESIGNCRNLERLLCGSSELTQLPESIGLLTALNELDISNTNITSLPSSIYNLTLETFDKQGLDIE